MAKGKKTGGRRVGTPNKGSLDLIAKCEAMGVDVFEELLKYLTYPCEPGMRLKAICEAAQYIYPKRKSLEHSGEIEGITITVHDYTKKK